MRELERAGVVPLPGRSAVYRALIRHRLIVPGKRKRRREDYRRWERGREAELAGNTSPGSGLDGMDAGLEPVPQYPLVVGTPADNYVMQAVHRLS